MTESELGLESRKRLVSILATVLATGLLIDQATKTWASAGATEPRILVPGYVAAYAVPNSGMVLGYAGKHGQTSTVFALLGILVAARLTWMAYADRRRWQGADWVPIGLLLAGIAGNTLDRLALGYVRDFLVIWAAPTLVFNVADLLVVAGGASLVLTRIYRDRINRGTMVIGTSC